MVGEAAFGPCSHCGWLSDVAYVIRKGARDDKEELDVVDCVEEEASERVSVCKRKI